MKSPVGKEDEKEPAYVNVKESSYMDMNKGKPSFFLVNTTTDEKENEKAQQEELPIALCSRLN